MERVLMWLDDCDDLLALVRVPGSAAVVSVLALVVCGVGTVVTWLFGAMPGLS